VKSCFKQDNAVALWPVVLGVKCKREYYDTPYPNLCDALDLRPKIQLGLCLSRKCV